MKNKGNLKKNCFICYFLSKYNSKYVDVGIKLNTALSDAV